MLKINRFLWLFATVAEGKLYNLSFSISSIPILYLSSNKIIKADKL